MVNLLDELGNRLFFESYNKIIGNVVDMSLLNKDIDPVLKTLIVINKYGHSFFLNEWETVEIVLSRDHVNHKHIERVAVIGSAIENLDFTLTRANTFEDFIDAVNGNTIDLSITELKQPRHIIWAIIVLKALLGMQGLPIIGDARRLLVDSFMFYGWTRPPVFFVNNIELAKQFPAGEDEEVMRVLNQISNMTIQQIFSFFEAPTQDGNVNYIKLHKPIFEYIESQFKKIDRDVKNILLR